jgi:predicted negative regulator of RcsB-dependent stress response
MKKKLFADMEKPGLRSHVMKIWKGIKFILMVKILNFAMLLGMLLWSASSRAQQGQASMRCTAYANSKVAAQYTCLARDTNGKVNFIQWEHGTASTGLGGWKQAGTKCFASAENLSWKICVD